MLKEFEVICSIVNITATGDIIKFRAPCTGIIKEIHLWADTANTNGDNVFNLNKNGTDLYSGSSRPTIAQNATLGSKTGLGDAVTFGDILLLQLESMATGGVTANLTLLIIFEDGQILSGILAKPRTNNIIDDEFEGLVLSSDWTKTNSANVESYNDKVQSAYYFLFNPSSSDVTLRKAFTPSSSDFSITLCAQLFFGEDFSNLGLSLQDSSGADLVQLQAIYNSGAKIRTNKIVSSSYTPDINTVAITPIQYPFIYLHIQRVSGLWNFYYSYNAIEWTALTTSLSHSFTVGKIAIQFGTGSGATKKITTILHWIRRDWLTL